MIETYDPKVFTEVPTMDRARWAILTPQGPLSTDQRWAIETPWLAEFLIRKFNLTSKSRVLDFGCGVGRVAKALIDACGCQVIGVDFSPKMREFAVPYVASDRFTVMAPEDFDRHPEQVDVALAIWVLQHCAPLAPELHRLKVAMRPNSRLFVLNLFRRSVPSVGGIWIDDGIDVEGELRRNFGAVSSGVPPRAIFGDGDGMFYWAVYRR
jgi:SAM-dependent methyltransferase